MIKKTVLVLGASGFIGRNIFEVLSQKDDIELFGTFSKNRFSYSMRLIQTDLTKRENVLDITTDMDIVIHAAAITDGSKAVAADPSKYISDNNIINTNVIDSCHKNKCSHLIFLSCSTLYPTNNPIPVKETQADLSKIHPAHFMGARVKVFAEDMCQYYSKLSRTRFTIIRHSNVYGPYDKFNLKKGHVFAATITKIMQAAEGQTVTVWGDGHEKRDLLHVSDLVRFIVLTLDYDNEYNNYDVINIGSGNSVSIRELVAKINSASGKNLPILYDLDAPTIDTDIVLDITKARQLGWQPKINLNMGIKQTIDWYLKNLKNKPS